MAAIFIELKGKSHQRLCEELGIPEGEIGTEHPQRWAMVSYRFNHSNVMYRRRALFIEPVSTILSPFPDHVFRKILLGNQSSVP